MGECGQGRAARRWCDLVECNGSRKGMAPAVALLIAALLPAIPPALAAEPELAPLQAGTVEPRAFGYRLGDVVERVVTIEIPKRLKLDEASLPVVGPQGPVLELRSIQRRQQATATGERLTLRLRYQVFAAPVAVRSYELPKLLLRFDGVPRNEELRIETWPLVVAAIAAEDASPREGLGELRPDRAPPLREPVAERAVLGACAAAALLLGGYLALVYFGLPWWGRGQRPFSLAWRVVQGGRRKSRGSRAVTDAAATPNDPDAQWREACRALHAAFDRTAGRTVFAESIDSFIAQAPSFAALKGDIEAFYARSQAAFFAGSAAAAAPSRDWLLAFARACRDAERGSA